MSKLGIRYIALFIAEDGHPTPVEVLYRESRDDVYQSLAVDLDALPPADAPAYEQHESQWLYHYARAQELRPDKNPDDTLSGELVRLRGENDSMRRALVSMGDRSRKLYLAAEAVAQGQETLAFLHAAALDYVLVESSAKPDVEDLPAESDVLTTQASWSAAEIDTRRWNPTARELGMIAIHRPTGIAVIEPAPDGADTVGRETAVQASLKLAEVLGERDRLRQRQSARVVLTLQECAALDALRRILPDYDHPVLASAIDKLRQVTDVERPR